MSPSGAQPTHRGVTSSPVRPRGRRGSDSALIAPPPRGASPGGPPPETPAGSRPSERRAVLPPVVLLVGPRLEGTPPVGVLGVPGHRGLDRRLPVVAPLPAQGADP